MKDQKGIAITNAFQKILDDLNRKANKILVDKGSEVYNRSMKLWLEKNDIETYSTHNEGKSVFAERFIRTLKNEIYKYMTSVSKNVYIDKLDDKVNKNNNTYDSTIKMKPFMQNQTHILTLVKKVMLKIQNLKLVIILQYQSIRMFSQNITLQIGLKKFL